MESKSPLTLYYNKTELSTETKKITKAMCSHWRPTFTTTPGNKKKVTPDGLLAFLPLSAILPLNNKRKMIYFPMDFVELYIDGLIDTSALSSAIPGTDLRKIRFLALHTKLNWGPPLKFQIMVANVQLEGCQWAIRSTSCNGRIAKGIRWHYGQRKVYSHYKTYT